MKRALLVSVALSTLAAIAACDGSGDDDDTGSPTPSPTSFVPVGCQIVWITQDPPFIDYYIVDAPVAEWTNGTHFYTQGDTTGATNVTGGFVNDFDLVTRTEDAAAVATNGDFQISGLDAANPLAVGNAVNFADATAQQYFLLDTANNLSAPQGSSGTGSFAGTWSRPDDPNVTEGSGTITILFQGTSHILGSDLTYALCYDEAGFAPVSKTQRLREAGARAAQLLRSR